MLRGVDPNQLRSQDSFDKAKSPANAQACDLPERASCYLLRLCAEARGIHPAVTETVQLPRYVGTCAPHRVSRIGPSHLGQSQRRLVSRLWSFLWFAAAVAGAKPCHCCCLELPPSRKPPNAVASLICCTLAARNRCYRGESMMEQTEPKLPREAIELYNDFITVRSIAAPLWRVCSD